MAYYFQFKRIQGAAETPRRDTNRCVLHAAPCYVLFGRCPSRNFRGAIRTTPPQVRWDAKDFAFQRFRRNQKFGTRCLIFAWMVLWNMEPGDGWCFSSSSRLQIKFVSMVLSCFGSFLSQRHPRPKTGHCGVLSPAFAFNPVFSENRSFTVRASENHRRQD